MNKCVQVGAEQMDCTGQGCCKPPAASAGYALITEEQYLKALADRASAERIIEQYRQQQGE